MPQAIDIELVDQQATPVDHTFVPLFQEGGVWMFEDQSAESPLGYNKITLSLVRPTSTTQGESSEKRVARVKVNIYTPVLEVLSNSTVTGITPAPQIAYTCRATAEFILPERCTSLDRQNIRGYMSQLLSHVSVVAMVDNLQGLY